MGHGGHLGSRGSPGVKLTGGQDGSQGGEGGSQGSNGKPKGPTFKEKKRWPTEILGGIIFFRQNTTTNIWIGGRGVEDV